MEEGWIEELEPEGGGALQTAKDLFAGAVGGVAQVLIGQPFDIVKVRLQTTSEYSSALHGAREILRNEGALAFYKGTLTPLVGIGACVSVQFGAYHAAKRFLESQKQGSKGEAHQLASDRQLSYPQFFLSGAFAGLANSGLSGPIEHIRIRLQSQPHGTRQLYRGPGDCIRQLWRAGAGAQAGVGAGAGAVASEGGVRGSNPAGSSSSYLGGLRGLYRGQTITLYRESVAYGSWFTTFEYLMNADAQRTGVPRTDMPSWKVALYGGLAGEALWLSSYPFDVIKSKMQTDGFGEKQKYRTMRDCIAQTWRESGARGFWKGIGPTLLRAMPVSAGTFTVVELTMKAIN